MVEVGDARVHCEPQAALYVTGSDQLRDPLASEVAVQRSNVRRVIAAIVLLYALSDGANAWLRAELANAMGHVLPWIVYLEIVACLAGLTAAMGLKTKRPWASQSSWCVGRARRAGEVLSLAQYGASLVAGHRSAAVPKRAFDDPFAHGPVIAASLAGSIMGTLALLAVLWLGYRYLTAPGAAKAADPGDEDRGRFLKLHVKHTVPAEMASRVTGVSLSACSDSIESISGTSGTSSRNDVVTLKLPMNGCTASGLVSPNSARRTVRRCASR